MTFYTDRYNIKPVLGFIALVVVIVFGLFATGTFQGFKSGQSVVIDGNIDGPPGFFTFRMPKIISFLGVSPFFALFVTIFGCSAFLALFIASFGHLKTFCLHVSVLRCLAFISFVIPLHILSLTSFALMLMFIFGFVILVKFSKRFDLFANSAGFCFNWFSHLVLSPIKNYLVRAGCWHVPAVGSSYFNERKKDVK